MTALNECTHFGPVQRRSNVPELGLYSFGSWLNGGPLFRRVAPKAAGRLTFRVSDAVRRRKVVDARTRGPRVLAYGDLSLGGARVAASAVDMRKDLRADRLILAPRSGRLDTDGPILAGMRPLCFVVHTGVLVPRSVVAAGVMANEPCRVTTVSLRASVEPAAERGADSDARSSR